MVSDGQSFNNRLGVVQQSFKYRSTIV